jgi:predicted transcriptional regulator
MSPGRDVLPHDEGAERAVLGAMLLPSIRPAERDHVLRLLEPGDFFSDRHQRAFAAMVRLRGRREPLDHVILTNELRKTDDLERTGGETYLIELVDAAVTAANVEYHARIVKEHATRRAVLELSERLADLARDSLDAPDLVERARAIFEGVEARAHVGRRSRAPLVLASTLKAEPVRYLVNPLLPRGMLTLLSATDKMGKTLLSMEIARAVRDGANLFGHFVVEGPGTVAAYWLDDPANLTAERLDARGLRAGGGLWVAPVLDVDLSDPLATIRDIERGARDVAADLVILDALYLFLPEGREAGNDAARMRPVMRALDRLAEGTGAAVLLIAHDRKGGDEVAGSYVIRAACKVILRLALPQGEDVDADEGPTTCRRVLRMQGKLAPGAAWSLELQGDGWRLLGTQAEARAETTRTAVRAHLENGSRATVAEIARTLGKRAEDVQAALKAGEAEGWAVGETGRKRGPGRPPILYQAANFVPEAPERNSELQVPVPPADADATAQKEFRSGPYRGESGNEIPDPLEEVEA